ncbi:MAG: hypothetical protein CMQ38_11960, partial [Gammaproteobacteria bacterium]|nr:hypothetical protein [Gammaproteobacteria bacterium]
GNWDYDLNNAAVQFLDAGETATDTYTFTVTNQDGATETQTVTITITGADDAMTVGGTNTGNVTEDGSLTATGTLTAADIDTTDNPLAYTVVTNQAGDNGFGDFSIDAAGNWDYDLNNASPAVQALDAGETLTDTYTFTVTNQDGVTETQTVSVTVTGTNDAPVITSDGSGATASINVPENTTAVTTVNVSDVDASDSQYYSLSGVDASLFSIDASGNLSFNTAPDFEEPHDANADGIYQLTVTTTDSEGATDSQDLTITVTNVDEGAPFAVADSDTANEGDSAVTGNVLANDTIEDAPGTVTAAEDDDGDAITIGAAFTTDEGGTLTINSDGSYSYTPPAVVNDIGGVTESFMYTVTDADGDTDTELLVIQVDNERVAVFTDSYVSGVTYTTSSGLTGITGDAGVPGSFKYRPGDTVTFSVGDVTVGEFSAGVIQNNILFLQDIAGVALSDVNNNYVENMAIFLQALDDDLVDNTPGDGTLQTNDLANADSSFDNGINITQAVRDAFTGYIDSTTGGALNLANAGKEMLSQALAAVDIEFTRDSERHVSGQNVFETIAMQHVADTIDDLAGARGPVSYDARTVDVLDIPGGTIEYNFNNLVGEILFDVADILEGATGKQVVNGNLKVYNISLGAGFEDIGVIENRGGGQYAIVLNAGVDQYDLEGLTLDYRVEDWTVFQDITSSAQDQYKSHLSATIPDVTEDVGFNQFTLNSELTFGTDQTLYIDFTSELLSSQLGYAVAEYGDDYLVPLEYSNDGGVTWQTMQQTRIEVNELGVPRPVFSFVLEAGNDAVDIRVPVFDDVAIEDPVEYFDATVTGDNVYDEHLQFGIIDNDVTPVTGIDIDFVYVREDDGQAVLTLTLNQASAQTVTVDYSTAPLGAQAGSDYQHVTGTVTFAPGETSQTISIPIINDFVIEANPNPELFVVNLSNAVNAGLLDPQATVRIFDDDAPFTLSLNLDIDPVTGDNFINDDETGDTIDISGSVIGTGFQTGQVYLTINGQVYQTNLQPDGNYTVAVSADDLLNDDDLTIDAVVYGYSPTGEQGTASASESYILDSIPTGTPDSDTASEGGATISGNVVSNDISPDGPITITAAVDDDGDIITVGTPFNTDRGGILTINSDGTYTYTPPALGTVPVAGISESFTVTLTDADGDSTQSTLTIAVTNTDQPVSPQGDTNTAKEAGPAVSGNVLTNDNIPDGGGSVVSVINAGGGNIPLGTQFTTANGGKLTINANGSYTYTPPPQGSVPTAGLSESFTYTVRDADGDTNQAVLNILVTDNDLTPTATPDTRTVAEGGAAVTGNVRTNDVFPDGVGPVTAAVDDDGHTITIGSAFTTDAGGILIINSNGSYSYTPPALGTVPTAGLTEVFTYTVTDADGDAVQSTLTLTVNNTDTQIIANNDSVTAREGGSIRTGNIFANDIVRDGPASVASVVYGGQQVTIGSTFTTTSGGRLTLNADGTFTYRPPVQGAVPSAGLTDTFTVQVRDADGDISQSSLSFVVANNIVNDQSNTGRPPGNQQGGGAQAPNVNVDTNPDFAPSVGAPESISDNIQVAVVTGTNQPQQPQVQTPQIPDIADLQQSNQILLTGNLQDQVIETGELTVSIQNAFQHTDPTESLRITATLEDGSPLPEYIQYDESSQQFILNADMANAQGITQETIVVRAEDSQGNATDARFNVFAPAATGANTEALNTLSDGGIISMVGDLQDQVLAGGRTTYQVSDAFLHSDPAEVLNITARLEDGSELPDYIQYDSNSQEFTLDSEAAAAAGVEGEVVVVVTAEDSQGNAATSRFSVVDANTAAATGTGIQTTDTGPADTAEASRLTLVSRPLDQRVEIDQQMIVVSIADNFQHTNPLETLTINARLADGSPLPGYIVFDQDNREFFIDGEMARALGINELEVIVEAEDSEGNSVVTRFRVMVDAAEIELEGETDAAAEGDETVMEDTEAAAEGEDNIESDQDLALTSEWESLELVAQGDAELQDLLAALAESDAEMDDELRDFAKENLNNQVLRAGEFGYQQEKMELKTLLEKIFSRG